MWKSFVLELHGEWSEFADECLFATGYSLRESADPKRDLLPPVRERQRFRPSWPIASRMAIRVDNNPLKQGGRNRSR
jgi:hypothetical protein